MYKSVTFNIFELNLEELVYGEKPPAKNNDPHEKNVVVVGEITIPKITEEYSGTNPYLRFDRTRGDRSKVL
jgi:hypothetical protein